jgi:Beta-lactamase enzyme family
MNRIGSTARSAILSIVEGFERLERELGGRSGAAFSVGAGPVTQTGSIVSGPAWSTIKVPLAIAALDRPGAERLAELAVTVSDNDAARALWELLGPPEVAASAVEAVLAAAGDDETRVQTEVVRPPYTSFGQTEWTLAAQQRFAAGLSAVPGAEAILELMRAIVPEQRWGFGAVVPGAAFKGGWGPDDRHLVRQFAIVTEPGRTVAAAIANESEDGSYESGAANLTRIAEWVMRESFGGR